MHTEQHLVVADLGPVDGNGAAGQLRGRHRSGPGTRSQATGTPAGSGRRRARMWHRGPSRRAPSPHPRRPAPARAWRGSCRVVRPLVGSVLALQRPPPPLPQPVGGSGQTRRIGRRIAVHRMWAAPSTARGYRQDPVQQRSRTPQGACTPRAP
jgi:hypothetical protein